MIKSITVEALVLVVKNLSTDAGDIRVSLESESIHSLIEVTENWKVSRHKLISLVFTSLAPSTLQALDTNKKTKV